LKELHEFLHMMGILIIFEEGSFIFSFVSYELMTDSHPNSIEIGCGCTFGEVVEKTKCQKMNVNPLTSKLR